MSEIHANIVVQPLDLNVTVEQPTITVAPEALGLQFYLGGIGVPGGNVNTVQYNAGGVLGGIPSVTWNGSKLSLGDTNNITISGGAANYALITDGAGNLSWGPTSNANYANFAGNAVYANNAGSANIANVANVAYSVSAANITGTIANSNYAAYAGNVTIAAQPNITSVGTLSSLSVSGTANLGNVSNVKITGGTNGYVLQTDGTGNLSWVVSATGSGNGVPGGSNTQVQFNDGGLFGGSANLTFNKTTSNLTVTGNIIGNIRSSNVIFSPVTSMPYGTEYVGITNSPGGTWNQNILGSSVTLSTANATGNTILNLRGNSTVTADSLIANSTSITTTYIMTTGANAYTVSTFQIDGANQTVNWVSGVIPGGAANSKVAYTFTAIKTSNTPTYTVLGSATRYA